MDQLHTCVICHCAFDDTILLPLDLLRPDIQAQVLSDCALPIKEGYICRQDLAKYAPAITAEQPQSECRMFADQADIQTSCTFSDRCSDHLTRFVGSWSFLIWFCIFLAIWIVPNVYFIIMPHFDPYPFIFLNLILAVISSVQAPLILMSQNRQAECDRIRATYDYAVDLKSEMEIRHIKKDIQHILRAIKKQ